MKNQIITSVIAFSLLFGTEVEAKGFGKKLKRFLGGVAEAAVVVAVDHAFEKYAPEQAAQYRQSIQELNEQSQRRAEADKEAWDEYRQSRNAELQKELLYTSDDDTKKMIRQEMANLNEVSITATNYNTSLVGSLSSEVGISQQNIRRGLEWKNAQNKYEKQNIIKDYVFDAAENIFGNPELLNKFRQISDAQYTYLSECSKAMTVEEKQIALSNRNRAYAEIGWNAYLEASDRRAEHLAEKLNIQNKLVERGWYADTKLAEEIAGSIIAIQKSSLSEDEKESLMRGYGFSESPMQIQQYVNEVLADNSNDADIEIGEEAMYQEDVNIAEQKAAEERKNAIQRIATTKIDSYPFDETSLSEIQESEIDDIASILNKYADVKVLLIGHTCDIGYKSINQRKGLKRAEIVKEYLIGKGVSQDRISIDSKGENQPLIENNSQESRKKNRRVEFVIE